MRIQRLILVLALPAALCFTALPSLAQTADERSTAPLAASARTVVPALVPYSAVAMGSDGKNLTGEIGITFLIYKDELGNEPLWTETQLVALDAAGQYKVHLGATSPTGLPPELFSSGEARWLEVHIAGEKNQPRVLLASVPYALKAGDAATLAGHSAGDFLTLQTLPSALQSQSTVAGSPVRPAATLPTGAQIANVTPSGSGTPNYVPLWTSTTALGNSVLYQSKGFIGLGTAVPSAALEVRQAHSGQTTLLKLGSEGNTNTTVDIDFSPSTADNTLARIGAIRTSYAYPGDTDLRFATYSNSVLQESMRITSYGWVGIGIQTPHALLEASAPTVTSGFGAYAITGVGGTATGNGIGGGIGIVGYGGGGTGYFEYADGSGGEFIGGNAAHEGDGLIAIAGSGYAGYFSGNVAASGTFTSGVVNNNVDHPLNPVSQMLVHSSIGSSEMLNIYTGNVTTDANGEATIQMAPWFESYNADFRYQLTAIGQFAQVIVSQKLSNNAFRIRSSVPNLEVSWQISAVRNDAYAKAHPLVVEQTKEPSQQGFYLHPELYGADEDHQLIWARHPAMLKEVKTHRQQQRVQATEALHPSTTTKTPE
jgi:hypothetical protein